MPKAERRVWNEGEAQEVEAQVPAAESALGVAVFAVVALVALQAGVARAHHVHRAQTAQPRHPQCLHQHAR